MYRKFQIQHFILCIWKFLETFRHFQCFNDIIYYVFLARVLNVLFGRIITRYSVIFFECCKIPSLANYYTILYVIALVGSFRRPWSPIRTDWTGVSRYSNKIIPMINYCYCCITYINVCMREYKCDVYPLCMPNIVI